MRINVVKSIELPLVVLSLTALLSVNFPFVPGKFATAITYLTSLLLVIGYWRRMSLVAFRDKALVLLLIVASCSFFWSEDPPATLDAIRGLLRTTLFGVYLSTRFTIKDQMRIWACAFAVTIALSLFFALGFGQALPWRGAFPHKNFLARVMAISAILFLNAAVSFGRRFRYPFFLGAALSVILLLLSQGKTALVAFVVMLLLVPVRSIVKQQYNLKLVLLSLGLLVSSAVIILLVLNADTITVDYLGKKPLALNGRLPIWALSLEKALERPWFGYGINAFWTTEASWYVTSNTWAKISFLDGKGFNAHNGYLSLFLHLGYLGLSLFAISFVATFSRVLLLVNARKDIESFWMLQVLVFITILNCFVGSTILAPKNALWALYISVALSSRVELRDTQTDEDLDRLRLSQQGYFYGAPKTSPEI